MAQRNKSVGLENINGEQGKQRDVFNIKLKEYEKFIRRIDYKQAIARYEWAGLPENIFGWNIERMLYYRNSIAFFNQGGVFYCLPYSNSGNINTWGMPTAVQPVSWSGVGDNNNTPFTEKSLPVNLGGAYQTGQAVVIFDSPPESVSSDNSTSLYSLNEIINTDLALRLAYLKINLINSNRKIAVYVDNEKQKEKAEQEFKDAFSPLCPFVVLVKSPLQTGKEGIDNKITNEEQSIWEDFSSLNNLRLYSLGIENNGTFQKKERQIVAEQVGGSEQTNLILQIGLETRKLAVEYLKKAFPEELKDLNVKIRESFIKTAGAAGAAAAARGEGGSEYAI